MDALELAIDQRPPVRAGNTREYPQLYVLHPVVPRRTPTARVPFFANLTSTGTNTPSTRPTAPAPPVAQGPPGPPTSHRAVVSNRCMPLGSLSPGEFGQRPTILAGTTTTTPGPSPVLRCRRSGVSAAVP